MIDRRGRTVLLIAAAACGGGGESAPDTAVSIAAADSIAVALQHRAGDLVIESVVAPQPVLAGTEPPPVAVYFVVRNTGAVADTLQAVEITGGTATLHQQTGSGGGIESMVPLTFAVIPPGESVRFVPGGRHIMIEGLTRPLQVGEVIPMTLAFSRAGRAPLAARVVRYADLERVLPADDHAGH